MTCKIGEKIRTLRLQNQMTQEQLADRLGVSYQSVSRWENGVTYPDIEYLPAIARHFSVTTDYLLGQDDATNRKHIRKQINSIAKMGEGDKDTIIDIIRTCRREQDDGEYFADICCALRYCPAWKDPEVLDELRKSKDLFFETCTNTYHRGRALEFYSCLEDESHTTALLDRYASDPANRDYLLKERYLFREELEKFDSARQRCFLRQLANLTDGDISLWRDSSKPATAEGSLFESDCKLALLHKLCREIPTEKRPITCGNPPDVFALQRIWIGMVYVTAYAAQNEYEKALAVLEDIIELTESLMALPDGAEIGCKSPALKTLQLSIEHAYYKTCGNSTAFYYTLENGESDFYGSIEPKWMYECLFVEDHSRWNWLNDIRKEPQYIALMERLKKLS